jgi:hypothetical protein
MISEVTSGRDGALLLGWLRLLGWHIDVEYQGGAWRGIARRFDGHGREHCIDRSAETHGELASELYYSALSGVAFQAAA